jgi:serine/threonine protein kinase
MSDLPDFSAYGYQTIRQLGLNAAGGRVVYLAAESNTQRQVVIKQFQFAKGSGWSEFKAVEREIEVLQGLNHKGIPHYLGSFESKDGYCIVQEYKNAQTLSALHSYTPAQIKQIAVSVLEILVYLQNRIPPIIHRDIKPENIVVDEQLNVYLIDFGFARLGGGTAAMSSVAAGTFGFMAPEQIYNKDLTEATDLYGLGATLVALLTATKSTEMDTLIDEDNKIAFQKLLPKLSFSFIDWLEKMVEPKLKDRYPDAATALEALHPLDIIRFPSVEFSQTDLEFTATRKRKWKSDLTHPALGFTATQLGEKLTRTIIIINPTPETVLEGKWSVASHPNDPPSLPNSDSHAWISFSPREFKGNEIECQITVDTSRLIAKTSGERSLVLHTNAVPETHALPLYVETAPFPIPKKLPYLITALVLIFAGFTGFLCAHFVIALGSNATAMTKMKVIIIWILLGTVFGRVLCIVLNTVFPYPKKLQFYIFVLLGAILGALFGFGRFGFVIADFFANVMLLVTYIILPFGISAFIGEDFWDRPVAGAVAVATTGVASMILFLVLLASMGFALTFESFPLAIVIALVVSAAAVILEVFARKYLGLDKARRYKPGFLILLMLSTGAFGISLGICLKIGLLSNLYLLLATLGTGVLSVFLFFFAPLQRRRLLAAYRRREPYLIRP